MDKLSDLAKKFKEPPQEYQPYVRWWWFGSAVTKDEIKRELVGMRDKKIGGVEIQPIYSALPGHPIEGLQDIEWLSPDWLEMIVYTVETAQELGMAVDMTFGNGWPFGGPFIPEELASMKISGFSSPLESAEKLEIPLEDLIDDPKKLISVLAVMIIEKNIISPDSVNLLEHLDENDVIKWDVPEGNWHLAWYFLDLTGQKVKRATPGGEGLVLDHVNREAFKLYAGQLGKAFQGRLGNDLGKWFGALFCDSWEVYNENWTPGLLDGFKEKMGYDLTSFLPILPLENIPKYHIGDQDKRIIYDYKKYHADLILNEFFQQFANWCRDAGTKCRVQPYSAPTDLLRAYGMLDILEIEGFRDQGISTMYYGGVDPRLASSGAHVYGKDLVSCESFTWLGGHFTVTLERLKIESDMIILHGVNRIIYHGYSYSPPEAGNPGWNFYASVSANHNNTWWLYMGELNTYIARNSFLSIQGKNVADFAVYTPYNDEWSGKRNYIKKTRVKLKKSGLLNEFDYINDERLLNATKYEEGKLFVRDGEYYALVLLDVEYVPLNVSLRIKELVLAGMPLVIIGDPPSKAPGYKALLERESKQVGEIFSELAECNAFLLDSLEDLPEWLDIKGSVPDFVAEDENGDLAPLEYLHRKMDDIDLYFIVNLSLESTRSKLYLRAQGNVELLDSMTGTITPIKSIKDDYNRTVVEINLKSHETAWIVVSEKLPEVIGDAEEEQLEVAREINLERGWKIEFEFPENVFPEEKKRVVFKEKDYLFDWQDDPDVMYFSGTAVYKRELNIDDDDIGGY
ncbi:MAG: glycosyl hydrolase, partial [Candidatus Hodarchaeota archaeon]